MKRKLYESPEVELFEVTLEQTILSNVGGVEGMNNKSGIWDEDDDY